jgi:hypothetical protein
MRAIFALLVLCAGCPLPSGYQAGPPLPSGAACVAAEETTSDVARIVADTVVCGELGEGGVDVFTVVNTSAVDLELHVETFGGDSGCLGDTDLVVRDLAGAVVTFDEELGIAECAWITVPIAARQALTVEVVAIEAGPYQLAVELFAL